VIMISKNNYILNLNIIEIYDTYFNNLYQSTKIEHKKGEP